MAIDAIPLNSRIQLRVIIGQDSKGNPIYRTRTYSNIKHDASDEDVYEVGSALADLQKNPLDNLYRVNNAILQEEG